MCYRYFSNYGSSSRGRHESEPGIKKQPLLPKPKVEKKRELNVKQTRKVLADKVIKPLIDYEENYEKPKPFLTKMKRSGIETNHPITTEFQSTHAVRQAPYTMMSQFVSFIEDEDTDMEDPSARKKKNKHANNNNFLSDPHNSSFIENKTEDSLSQHTKTQSPVAAPSSKSNLMLLKHMHEKNNLLHRIQAKDFGHKKYSDCVVSRKEASKSDKNAQKSLESNGSHRPIISILDAISKINKKKKNAKEAESSSEEAKTPFNESLTHNQLVKTFSNKVDLNNKKDLYNVKKIKKRVSLELKNYSPEITPTQPDKTDQNILWLEQGHFSKNYQTQCQGSNFYKKDFVLKPKNRMVRKSSDDQNDDYVRKMAEEEKNLVLKEKNDKLDHTSRRKIRNSKNLYDAKKELNLRQLPKNNNNINNNNTNNNNTHDVDDNDDDYDDDDVQNTNNDHYDDESFTPPDQNNLSNGFHYAKSPPNDLTLTRVSQETLKYQFLFGDLFTKQQEATNNQNYATNQVKNAFYSATTPRNLSPLQSTTNNHVISPVSLSDNTVLSRVKESSQNLEEVQCAVKQSIYKTAIRNTSSLNFNRSQDSLKKNVASPISEKKHRVLPPTPPQTKQNSVSKWVNSDQLTDSCLYHFIALSSSSSSLYCLFPG